ncbi:MAG: toxin-antitoxin system, antitoxin component, Xre family protein [Ruminococcus sp.]|nr:toxin-antitoxin system, antitoxin component, Xre family protein [Ruminococcus sp.]
MNLEYLNGKIALSRIPITAIAEEMGLSRQSLYLKMKGERDFKTSEVEKLCEVLRLTDDERLLIFFAEEVDSGVNTATT